MKSLRLLFSVVPILLSMQLSALIAITSMVDQVCYEGFAENGIVLEGEFQQYEQIPAVAPDDPQFTQVYRVQYKVNDLWCGNVNTISEPMEGVPNYWEGVENTDELIWVIVRVYNNLEWEVPAFEQRQLIVADYAYNAFYQVGPGLFQPANIDEDDTVTSTITTWEVETLHIDDIRTTVENCTACNISSGIDHQVSEFNVFPNPVENEINFESSEWEVGVEYQIFTTTGALIQRGQLSASNQVDASELSPGLYYVSISDRRGQLGYSEFVKH